MQADETLLTQKYNLVKLNVISSTQISNRTSAVAAKLGTASVEGKPVIVVLSAKSKAANKLVSIVEIAKRELAAQGTNCFQYNVLTSEMTEIKRNARESSDVATEDAARPINGSDSEAAFETMGTRDEIGSTKRLVPVITTYLCTTSVKELRTAYG